MNQLNFYKYTTLGMLILNISMIAFFFLTKPNPHQMPPPPHSDYSKKRATDILKLDEVQNEVFIKSAQRHDKQMQEFNAQQKELLKIYFQSLTDTSVLAVAQRNLEAFTQLEKQKIEYTYQHFKEIKATLKPEQMADFNVFMKNIQKKILPNRKKNLPPPKDF